MGIEGLQSLIKPALESTTLHQFKGQRAAIDAMSFLYKGCYSYSYELNNGVDVKDYMLYLLRIVRIVKHSGIEPVVVFDGRSLKVKELTQKKREDEKEKNLKKAKELMEEGKEGEAQKFYQRCLRVSKQMVYDTIDMLRVNSIDYLISPYEADSQVSYMVKSQQFDIAITEDSDLICYACPKIIFKLQLDSTCQFLDLNKYTESQEERSKLKNEPLRCFLGQSELNRILICIMAGSDYFPNIQGIGIKRAIDLFYKCATFQNVMTRLRSEPKMKQLIPENYELFVEKISLVFQHQTVYDVSTKKLIPLVPTTKDFTSEDQILVGEKIPNFEEVSRGQRHIYTLEKRVLTDIDMKTYFNSKFQRKKFTISQPATNISTGSGVVFDQQIQTNINEKLHYESHQVNPEQIKKLLKPSEIEELRELKRREEEEINRLIEEYDPELGEDDNEIFEALDKYNGHEDIEDNFAKFGESYLYRETYLQQKKESSDYTSYLKNLCNTFLTDYKQFFSKEDSQNVKVTTTVKRANSNLTEKDNLDDENNDQKEGQQKTPSKLYNPFAKRSQKDSAFQPDSLEDLNLKRATEIPSKKVIINNQQKDKDGIKPGNNIEIDMSQKSASNSQKKVTLKDFFSKKKK